MSAGAAARREALIEVYNEASVCTRCPLAETRTKVVFGAGDADADLMFVGEAPGADEDRRGLPFVGRAGGLLTELIEGIGLTRDRVWIGNVIKCRPPGNRDPQPNEIESCRPYLERQVELVQPRVIATLGNFATKLLTGNPAGITRVRGAPQHHVIAGRAVHLLPLLHPAAALRNPSLVETLHGDFILLGELIAEPLPKIEPAMGEIAAASSDGSGPDPGPGIGPDPGPGIGPGIGIGSRPSTGIRAGPESDQLDLLG